MDTRQLGLLAIILSGFLSLANLFITGASIGSSLFNEYLPMTNFILLIFGLYALVKFKSKQ